MRETLNVFKISFTTIYNSVFFYIIYSSRNSASTSTILYIVIPVAYVFQMVH